MHLELVHPGESISSSDLLEEKAEPPKTLPAACVAARDGDETELMRLHATGQWDPLSTKGRDKHGYRAHHWAAGAENGCLQVCLRYASAKDIDEVTLRERRDGKRGGRSLLHWAARNGVIRNVALLLQRDDVDASARTNDGTTALMLALYGGHLEICAMLPFGKENDYGCNEVHWAAMGTRPFETFLWLDDNLVPTSVFAQVQCHGHSVFHKLVSAKNHFSDDDYFNRTLTWLIDDKFSSGEENNHLLADALAPDRAGRRPSDIAKCNAQSHYIITALQTAERLYGRPS